MGQPWYTEVTFSRDKSRDARIIIVVPQTLKTLNKRRRSIHVNNNSQIVILEIDKYLSPLPRSSLLLFFIPLLFFAFIPHLFLFLITHLFFVFILQSLIVLCFYFSFLYCFLPLFPIPVQYCSRKLPKRKKELEPPFPPFLSLSLSYIYIRVN